MVNNLKSNEIEHFVADYDTDNLIVDEFTIEKKVTGIFQESLAIVIRNPLFWVSSIIILILGSMALFPNLWTGTDPFFCPILDSSLSASAAHPMGTTLQGCDVYSRVINGARPSLAIGIMTTIIGTAVGVIIGTLAGFFGGILDSILSRLIDIFYAIPFILAAVAVLQLFESSESIWKVIFTLSVFAWVSPARLMRSQVLSVKQNEFITASVSLGASKLRNMFMHILPNAISPVISTATINIGAFIVAESTLSFLGLGLGSNSVSWGQDIANARDILVTTPSVLLWPSLFLAITTLSFIFLGDAIRDALNPKGRR
ncbi:MAG: ABC transporter permease [Bifidobacteriaceae bacterium]|jgi:oligopeptide transport system permease protein|nr:ABC transporter permease [Bifidobacteriaceae bacterium]